MGNALEADERPWGDHGDFDDLRNGARIGNISGRQRPVQSKDGSEEHARDAQHKSAGEDDHEACRQALFSQAEERRQADGQQRKNGLAQVHVIAKQRVEPAEAKGPAQEVFRKQRQRGGVRPKHCQVGQGQEPGRQKAVVMAEHLLGIGVRAARFGIALHHVGVVFADHQHGCRAEHHAQHTAQDAGLNKIGIGGDDQRSPADARADGKRPGCRRGDVPFQPPLLVQSHGLHLPVVVL